MKLVTRLTMSFPIGKTCLLFLSITFFAACSDEKSDSPSTTVTAAPAKTDTANRKVALASVGEFPVLCYDSTEIRNIFNSQPTPFKLVFIFNFADTEAYNPSLKFYPARNTGVFIGSSYHLTRTKFPLGAQSTVLNLGNLELKRSDLGDIPGRGTHLKFYPRMSSTNPGHITYVLRWGTCEEQENFAQLTGVELNPCPPNQPSN